MSLARPRTVVKIGSSSVTTADGFPAVALLARLAAEISEMNEAGSDVVVVSSGAVAAGWAAIGNGGPRPSETSVLQAVSAVGQHRLMSVWSECFEVLGRTVGQVLLAPLDFAHRQQYLHARQTLDQLLVLGVIPIVNENDAVADDEIRFGDNDRLAALVAHLVGAERLVMLTDAPGLLTADPRLDAHASLIEEVTEIDRSHDAIAGGPGEVGSGGMASKLAAARIATWSGVEAVIAPAHEAGVLATIADGSASIGTTFRAQRSQLSARKLWIAFAVGSRGTLSIDAGAVEALVAKQGSLLARGVTGVSGTFAEGDPVEIVGPDGSLVAKGLCRTSSAQVTQSLSGGTQPENGVCVHRDDLAVLVGQGPETI
ncbi:MAG: glutamate 5-kinase [Actinomycetes bacterium]